MANPEDDFFKRLLATFRLEAREHLDALFAGIAELERGTAEAGRAELVERVFREAHSLKGAARSVNQAQIEAICQSLETTFAALKQSTIAPAPALFDGLHLSLKQLGALLDDAAPAQPGLAAAPAAAREAAPPQPPAAADTAPRASTVRISTDRLDAIFLQVEEMLSAKLLTAQRMHELRALQALAASWGKELANLGARHPARGARAGPPPSWQELLDQNTAFVKSLTHQLNALTKAAEQDQRMIGRMVDDLLDDMKKALMVPFSSVLQIFPRLVRDLARDHGKEIELIVHGDEIEADRRILEAIKDPLVHLVRNCIDHGIERPEERLRRQKPARGKIVIGIAPRSGNRVEISVFDDGAGIDTSKVRATAERLGLLNGEEAARLGDGAAIELIYRSGLSTSPIVTEISGRGLGLAIVREKVDKLGGTITVATEAGASTRFRIVLPLTLATYRGITVRLGEQIFVLPTSQVEQTARVPPEQVRPVENRDTIVLGGETLALVWLGDVLGVRHHAPEDAPFLQVAVLAAGGRRIAFVVDEVLQEQEVLVKSLGRQLARVRNVAAATILGSGKAIPILNVSDLMKSALQAPGAASRKPAAPAERPPERQKSVLVAEDSITSRNLLKGILELAGYRVGTAVDGVDGLSQLRSGTYDLVVSDVEMPRMNGFELTASIRADQRLRELPVVLVTALESREDRERGIDVGASAYIVKRSFEQSDLLEVIGRLI